MIRERTTCAICEKWLTGWQSKFCSLSCSAKHRNIGRNRTESEKDKISAALKQRPGPRDPTESRDKSKEPVPRYCVVCGGRLTKGHRKYCSDKHKELHLRGSCVICRSGPLKRKTLYCCAECRRIGRLQKLKVLRERRYRVYVEKWLSGKADGVVGLGVHDAVRWYLFKKHDYKCEECGWSEENPSTGNVPLCVHHVDGVYSNNDEQNLRLLCPNCHALTDTCCSLNNGRGRNRRK